MKSQVLIKKLKISKFKMRLIANTVGHLLSILLTQIKTALICQGLVANIVVFLDILL